MTNQALGKTIITQVGVIVADIEAKAEAWADLLGVPVPEIIITDGYDLARTKYEGEASPARAKLVFLTWVR